MKLLYYIDIITELHFLWSLTVFDFSFLIIFIWPLFIVSFLSFRFVIQKYSVLASDTVFSNLTCKFVA